MPRCGHRARIGLRSGQVSRFALRFLQGSKAWGRSRYDGKSPEKYWIASRCSNSMRFCSCLSSWSIFSCEMELFFLDSLSVLALARGAGRVGVGWARVVPAGTGSYAVQLLYGGRLGKLGVIAIDQVRKLFDSIFCAHVRGSALTKASMRCVSSCIEWVRLEASAE